MPMGEQEYLDSIYRLVEHIIEHELLDTSKRLLINYIERSPEPTMAEKARAAVVRYLQKSIPTLDEIRSKSKTTDLNELDHLILKMEYEARRFRLR
jgi:hypothetical protein